MEIRIFDDIEGMSLAAAAEIEAVLQRRALLRRRVSISLSGGTTPRKTYSHLAELLTGGKILEKLHIFWSDERHVPHDSADSNYRMVREVFLSRLSIAENNIHAVPFIEGDPAKASRMYEKDIGEFFHEDIRKKGFPVFDVIVLGIGTDGHTASLFPGDPVLDEEVRLAKEVTAPFPVSPAGRITLTLPVINSAMNVFFLASGRSKNNVVSAITGGGKRYTDYPASLIRPPGSLTYFLDREAAGSILRD